MGLPFRFREGPSASRGGEVSAGALRILRLSLVSMFWGGAGVSVIALAFDDDKTLVGSTIITVLTPPLLWSLRRGHARFAMTSAVIVLLAVVMTEVAISDGIHDVGVNVFAALVLISALLLNRLTSVVLTVLTVLSIAAIGIAELTGVLHTRLSPWVTPSEVAILVLLVGCSSVLIHAVTRALYKGMDEVALHEQTYREIFNATSEGIFVCDVDSGRIVDVNDTATAITGLPRQALCGAVLTDLVGRSNERDAETVEALNDRVRRATPQAFEWKLTRPDGREVWLEVALRPATLRGEARVLAAVRDVSDRRAVAERLRAAERLQAVGQLAGGVAHDFNNQLGGILANAALLKEHLRTDETASSYVEEIVHASNRSADLTRQLLAFARKGGRREAVIDIDALVREIASLLERSIDKRVELALELCGDRRARVIGDASFLQSALLNLGINARDAMPDGGTLRFETARIGRDELPSAAAAQVGVEAQECVRVRVSDTGVGMAPELLGRIFEPFFTTKANGHGLGLPAAYGTVHALGGAILVYSAVGVGTCFELFLPATDRPLPVETKPHPSQPLPKIRVLLAEDERVLGRATEALLQDLGCKVTWCRDGREALKAFERDASAFDLLVLDHSMPGMLGSEVAERALSVRPKLPIISTSGFSEDVEAAAARNRVFLQKPFDLEQLTAAVRQALGGHA